MLQKRVKTYSILIVPDDGSRTHELKISSLLLKIMVVFVGVGMIMTVFGGLAVWHQKTWSASMETLKVENARLRANSHKVEKLSKELEGLKATDQQIRTMLSGSLPLSEANYDLPEKASSTSTEQGTGLKKPAPQKMK